MVVLKFVVLYNDIQGCDASLLLDDSNGNQSHPIERNAVPNQTLKAFEIIDMIKQALETECPGVVSCADIIALASRDSIILVCYFFLIIAVCSTL